MWIMVSGPYSHDAKTAAEREANLRELNKIALEVFGKGHLPLIGVNLALPMTLLAPDRYTELMMPISLALAERCDAVLRVGGESFGADQEVQLFEQAGKPVFRSLDEIPKTVHFDEVRNEQF